MSRSGRYVVVVEGGLDGGKVDVVDAIGTAPRILISDNLPLDLAAVGEAIWLLFGDELVIMDFAGNEIARHRLDGSGAHLSAALGAVANTALLVASSGSATLLALTERGIDATPITGELAGGEFISPVAGFRVASARGREYQIGIVGRGVEHSGQLPGDGVVIAATEILAGKALAIASQSEGSTAIDVVRHRGSLIHHIKVERLETFAFAETRGLVFGSTGSEIFAIDLRYGRVLHTAEPPLRPLAVDIDAEARQVVMAGYHEGAQRLSVYHVPFADVFVRQGFVHAPQLAQEATSKETDAGADDEAELSASALANERGGQAQAVETPEEVVVPSLPLRGLRNDSSVEAPEAVGGAEPYSSPMTHFSDLLDLVLARTAFAIANAWDTGELSQTQPDGLPFEREVRALVGHRANAAPTLVEEASAAVEHIAQVVAARTHASLAAGQTLPLIEVCRQFNLSQEAAQIISVVAAPSLRREAARLYGVLSNDTARPVCDRALVESILAADRPGIRAKISNELDSSAPLIANGLLRVGKTGASERLFAALAIDTVLLRRLLGEEDANEDPGSVSTIKRPDRAFEELAIPATIKRDLVVGLAEPSARPPRIVIRGRPGFGRTTTLVALAAKVGLPLAVIDAERLPTGATFPSRLRSELQRATLRGAIPCVRGLENRVREEADYSDHLREVFRAFPGPIGFRTSVEYHMPLDPGFLSFALPTLLESERQDVWEQALARRGLVAHATRRLASRYLVGPGTIESIVRTLDAQSLKRDKSQDVGDELDRAARQHLEARLGDVANRVNKLARWEQVALPDEMMDSIREFIGRVVHRRIVYEKWGFADKMATSRGLTALFYGQPGTGKTMVAGLIARELGLDLYRVDLANVTSKWIGETEKNLGRVFDAAEDGQAVILFDEADSLFAKRTEIKSSVDRYANLEVNYLLQRFDSFEGVAILTTNMEGAIDSAFKRRLSLRLEFPFPDEEMRIRLWAAHIPSQAPIRGDFDFESLAKRFPMSGGYIRNSALRAAFLAAQEGVPLGQEHLERAINLEYREMGKLSPGGRMA